MTNMSWCVYGSLHNVLDDKNDAHARCVEKIIKRWRHCSWISPLEYMFFLLSKKCWFLPWFDLALDYSLFWISAGTVFIILLRRWVEFGFIIKINVFGDIFRLSWITLKTDVHFMAIVTAIRRILTLRWVNLTRQNGNIFLFVNLYIFKLLCHARKRGTARS